MARRILVDGRLVSIEAPVHGTAATYTNWGCRCPDCSASHKKTLNDRRLRRLEQRIMRDGRLYAPNARAHGLPQTYTNWGCRCEPCTDAAVAHRRNHARNT